jgi:hypothetical protein
MVWAGIGMYGAVAAGAPLGLWLMKGQWPSGGFIALALVALVCSISATPVGTFVARVAPHGGERSPFFTSLRIAPLGAGLMLATQGSAGSQVSLRSISRAKAGLARALRWLASAQHISQRA